MNLQQISYLMEIDRCGSINKAAQNLFVSQPHLSNIVKEIETELRIKVFERTQTGVQITEDGKDFLLHAKSILNDFNSLKESFTSKVDERVGRFTLSTTRSSHIMEVFINFCKTFSSDERIKFTINEGNTDEVITDVFENNYDLGVIFFNSIQKNTLLRSLNERGLGYKSFLKAKPHIMLSQKHPLLVEKKPINSLTLANYGFVRYIDPYENFMHFLIEQDSLWDFNNSKKIVHVFGRSSLLNLISSSDMFGIGINSFQSQQHLYNIVSVPIENSNVTIECGYIYLKNRQMSSLTKSFTKMLIETFAEEETEKK